MNRIFFGMKWYKRGLLLAVLAIGLSARAWAGEAEAVTPTAAAEPVKSLVVVLDPGHGGMNLGQRLSPTLLEKDFTFKLAQDIKALLGKDAGKTVWLTRTRDNDVSLAARQALANAKHAQLFISLHAADTALNPPQIGLYTHRVYKDDERLNSLMDQAKDKKLEVIPWERAQDPFGSSGENLSDSLKDALEKLPVEHGPVPKIYEVKMPLAVLLGVQAPAVMLEMPVPAGLNAKTLDAYCRHVAEAVAAGVNDYAARR